MCKVLSLSARLPVSPTPTHAAKKARKSSMSAETASGPKKKRERKKSGLEKGDKSQEQQDEGVEFVGSSLSLITRKLIIIPRGNLGILTACCNA